MASKTTICNMALSHLGVGKEIANIDTEQSQEAVACRRYYETVLEMTLRDYDWPFATVITELALIEEDPNTEWGFSYRYPSECVKIRRILSGIRNDNHQTRVPYKIAKDSAGQLLFCDTEDASIEYTEYIEDPQFYPGDFTMAFSYHLSAHIAPRLTAGDPYGNREKMIALYLGQIDTAKKNAMNEEQSEVLPESEFIRARGGDIDD